MSIRRRVAAECNQGSHPPTQVPGTRRNATTTTNLRRPVTSCSCINPTRGGLRYASHASPACSRSPCFCMCMTAQTRADDFTPRLTVSCLVLGRVKIDSEQPCSQSWRWPDAFCCPALRVVIDEAYDLKVTWRAIPGSKGRQERPFYLGTSVIDSLLSISSCFMPDCGQALQSQRMASDDSTLAIGTCSPQPTKRPYSSRNRLFCAGVICLRQIALLIHLRTGRNSMGFSGR